MSFSFHPLEVSAKPIYDAAMCRYPTHSDFHFSGAFAWDSSSTGLFAVEGDALVIDIPAYHGDARQVSFLAHQQITETAHRLLDWVGEKYGQTELSLISDWMLDRLGHDHGFRVEEDPGNADYLYSSALLASLRGKRFKGKAAKADAFESEHEPVITPLDPEDDQCRRQIEECFGSWCECRGAERQDVEDERLAVAKLLQHARELQLEALGLYVDGVLTGFTIFELVQSSEGAVCLGHFQKIGRPYTGATESMMRSLGQHLVEQGVEIVNWEQDLGLPGLRQAKRAYLPIAYRRKFFVSR